MKRLIKSGTIGILGAFVAVTLLMSVASVPTVQGETVNFGLYKWSYRNSIYRFWYKDLYGKSIASKLAAYRTVGYLPFIAAGKVLAAYTKPRGLIDVYINPYASGYGGHFWFKNGSKRGLNGQYIYMKHGRSSSNSNLINYAKILAHESSHLIYMNYTRGYTMDWFWNSSYNGFKRDRALTESIAYYTGDFYYPWYIGSSNRYSYATVRHYIRGYQQLLENSAYRYTHSGFTDRDWWNFHAFGYWLAKTGKLARVVGALRYYISRGSNYAFQNSYENVFRLKWSDWEPASTQIRSCHSNYVYYRFYWYWNS